ncbi:MAG: SpoIIE family protein phosphatase [Candidatus Riflebacteria bacterium]|nr:SpoIIE family protein phosphatase [Candidatus Riflebacteria bacterium]
MITARRWYMSVLFIGFAINFAIIYGVQNFEQKQAEMIYIEELQKVSDKLHSSFSYEKLFEKIFFRFFESSEGKTLAEFEAIYESWLKKIDFDRKSFEIIVYNGHNPLNKDKDSFADWKFVMDVLDSGEYQSVRTIGETKNFVIKTLTGGVGFESIECKPGFHRRLSLTGIMSYGVWFKSKNTLPESDDLITAILFLSNEKYIKKSQIANVLFNALKVSKSDFGYLNTDDLTEYLLPEGVSARKIVDILNLEDIKSGYKRMVVDNKNVFAAFRPDGNVFIAVEKEVFIPMPFWACALFFFWLPLWYRLYTQNAGDLKLSLTFLMSFLFVLVVLLPSIAIAFFWRSFLESRYETIKLSKIAKMQNAIVQIDANSTEIYRVYKDYYEKAIALFDMRPHNVQAFIDRTVELELQGVFDTCIIMDKEGNLLRKNASVSSFMRSLPMYPDHFRYKMVEHALENGWVPFDKEIDYVLQHDQENFTVESFLAFSPEQGKRAATSIVRVVTRDLINQYNSSLGKIVKESAKDQISSAVISSIVGEKDENPLAKISHSLGEFFEFGYGRDNSRNYVNIIRDKDGSAKYCFILFSGLYNFTRGYLKRLFAGEGKFSDEMKLAAISNKIFCVNYPQLDLWKRFGRILNVIQPPINMYSEEVNINGEPHILCAYAGKKTDYYVYVAYMPISVVIKELNSFKYKMFLAAFLILLSLGFVTVRLYRGIVCPTQLVMAGISAMETGNHDHRIKLHTGDEWEQLAGAFNSSLESMKEFEVASFIQETILPSGERRSGSISFSGRTVSADGIGGDYYDAYLPNDNEMLFLLGDVSGHSVSAALVVSMAHAGFAALFEQGIREPSEILKAFNSLMLNNLQRVKMMTCFAGFIDSEGYLYSSNAGQTFPLIVDENGVIESIAVVGYPLGSSKRVKYKQSKIKLPDKCRIIMYSDGIIEALNESGEPFGFDRFEKLVKKIRCNDTPEDFYNEIYSTLKEYSGSVPWDDDCTIALVEYERKA